MDESHPTSVINSLVKLYRNQRHSNTLVDEPALGLDLLVQAFDDYIVNAIEPTTSLSLNYSKLIDWNSNASNEVRIFQNDYALVCYLNTIESKNSSTSE